MSLSDPISAHIREAATRALALQTTVSENAQATAALAAATKSLDAARAELPTVEKQIWITQGTVRVADHERHKYNDSSVRRGLLSALGQGGTHDTKAAETQTEYDTALAQQHALEARRDVLRRTIQETEPAVDCLRQRAQLAQQNQSALDAIYASIFDDAAAGPALFPADMALRKTLADATAVHLGVIDNLSTQKEALKLLYLAEDSIYAGALKPLDHAIAAISRVSLKPGLVSELDFTTSLKRIAACVRSAAQNTPRPPAVQRRRARRHRQCQSRRQHEHRRCVYLQRHHHAHEESRRRAGAARAVVRDASKGRDGG